MKMNHPERILLLFVDGFGIPPEFLGESIYSHCPTICRLFTNHCVPLDATLGIPGIPQSATGQSSIFTGINAAHHLGKHLEAFPNAELRSLIQAENLFSKAGKMGKKCTFSNAYLRYPGAEMPERFRSVTTVMTVEALGTTRNRKDLLEGRAVFHDITGHTAESSNIEGIPIIEEKEAAKSLMNVLREVDLCLFEYFLSDRAGHRASHEEKQKILRSLDSFFEEILAEMDLEKELFLLISDHGNIESQGRLHSLVPVPWVAVGKGAELAREGMKCLTDVTPKILSLLQKT